MRSVTDPGTKLGGLRRTGEGTSPILSHAFGFYSRPTKRDGCPCHTGTYRQTVVTVLSTNCLAINAAQATFPIAGFRAIFHVDTSIRSRSLFCIFTRTPVRWMSSDVLPSILPLRTSLRRHAQKGREMECWTTQSPANKGNSPFFTKLASRSVSSALSAAGSKSMKSGLSRDFRIANPDVLR